MTRRPHHSTVIALVALFVALGGTSYAAFNLPANSVKGRNIAPNAVTSAKVKDRSLLAKDFAKGQVPRGKQGAQGLQGKQGVQGTQGIQGIQGKQGNAGPYPSTLPSGATVRGVFQTHCCTNGLSTDSISFGYTLSSSPTVHYIQSTASSVPAGCSGAAALPGADPGNLCIFETNFTGVDPGASAYDPSTFAAPTSNTSSPFGAVVSVPMFAADATVRGSWAVTAP